MPQRAEILMVEDDPNDVEVARRAFRRSGLERQLKIVPDGRVALDYVHPRPDRAPERNGCMPRVIFLDVKLPGLNGWDVLRCLREDRRTADVPVVMVSSSSREADVRNSYREGANSYLVKRYDREQPGQYLVDAARYWLELNRGPYD